jgi:hypothetical protein
MNNMIQLCANIASEQAEKCNAEFLTGWSTFALAALTVALGIFAYVQLKDIKKFIRRYTKVSKAQSTENTIIKQIEFHHKILDRMSTMNINGQQMSFRDMSQTLDGIYKLSENPNIAIIKQIKNAFSKLYLNTHGILGSYYKNLYCLVKYIHELGEKYPKRSYYIDLVKAQLSKYEIILLFYDCIWIDDQEEGENFIDYAIGLNLLSALEDDGLIRPTHKELFDQLKREFARDKKITSILEKDKQ